MFDHDSRCNRITLRARKALRVICLRKIYLCKERSTFPGAEPPAGPKIFNKSLGESTFSKISLSCKNLSLHGNFSQTHKWTQRKHFWIADDLSKGGKLLRSKTNSRILRNLHFCHQNHCYFESHVRSDFPMQPYYSKS